MKDYYDMTPEEQLQEDYRISKEMEEVYALNPWMVKKDKLYITKVSGGRRWEDLTSVEQNELKAELDNRFKRMEEITNTVHARLVASGKIPYDR